MVREGVLALLGNFGGSRCGSLADRRGVEASGAAVLSFPVAIDAVTAAVAAHRWASGAGVAVGIGVHTTDVVSDDDCSISAAVLTTMALASRSGPDILLTGLAAALATPALPLPFRLVRSEATAAGTRPDEVVHRLVAEAPAAHDDGRHGPPLTVDGSNLAWARRRCASPGPDRQHERMVQRAWRSTLRGERRGVLVCDGAGRSAPALVASCALRMHAEGALVLHGRCDGGRAALVRALANAFGGYADRCSAGQLRAELGPHLALFTRLLPDLGARLAASDAGRAGDPWGALPEPLETDEAHLLLEAVEAWLEVLARRQPVVLVIEDVHRGDDHSHRFLDDLLHAAGTAPWTLLMTSWWEPPAILRSGPSSVISSPIHVLSLPPAGDQPGRDDHPDDTMADGSRWCPAPAAAPLQHRDVALRHVLAAVRATPVADVEWRPSSADRTRRAV
jgi:hypothetical protein